MGTEQNGNSEQALWQNNRLQSEWSHRKCLWKNLVQVILVKPILYVHFYLQSFKRQRIIKVIKRPLSTATTPWMAVNIRKDGNTRQRHRDDTEISKSQFDRHLSNPFLAEWSWRCISIQEIMIHKKIKHFVGKGLEALFQIKTPILWSHQFQISVRMFNVINFGGEWNSGISTYTYTMASFFASRTPII